MTLRPNYCAYTKCIEITRKLFRECIIKRANAAINASRKSRRDYVVFFENIKKNEIKLWRCGIFMISPHVAGLGILRCCIIYVRSLKTMCNAQLQLSVSKVAISSVGSCEVQTNGVYNGTRSMRLIRCENVPFETMIKLHFDTI